MGGIASREIQQFLQRLGDVYQEPARLFLIGGGALCMLGHTRRTMDIDFSLSLSEQTKSLRDLMHDIADELGLELEVITLEEFVPVPVNASHRHQFIGQFGVIEVYVYDPYTIALSKLARGFETDIQDILFLLEEGFIHLDELTSFVDAAIPVAWEYDVDPANLREYLNEVRRLFEGT